MTKEKVYLTVNQVSERYSLAPGTLYNMVCQKKIPFVKVGRALRFDRTELKIWEKHNAPITTTKQECKK